MPQAEAGSVAPSSLLAIEDRLALRLGPVHARQRLGIEEAHEAQAFGQRLNLFQIESWYSVHGLVRGALRAVGLYGRGRRNAERVRLVLNRIESARLPAAFDGLRILHLSDLHADMSVGAMERTIEIVAGLEYDLAVITGDFRGKTFGPFEAAVRAAQAVVAALTGPVYGVLGNHDTVRMAPALEDAGLRMLMNECVAIERGGARIHLAGIDDAHFYRVDNIEKAASGVPESDFSILLSHTPEIYRQAAHAGFDVLLAGHTHGGQICLPGGVPVTLDSNLPRAFGAGAWRYHEMIGYTSPGTGSSVEPVRFNCPPEVTLHRLVATQ